MNKYSGIFYQVRSYLSSHSLNLIYYSLVYSAISYGIIIWGNAPKTYLNKLFIAQKRIVRTIKFRKKYDHTNDDFYILQFLKIKDIVIYFASIFVYKSINGLCYPSNYFQSVDHNHQYFLRNNSNLRSDFTGSTHGQSSPNYYCTAIWNNFPLNIRNSPSLSPFKRATKCYLLNRYRTIYVVPFESTLVIWYLIFFKYLSDFGINLFLVNSILFASEYVFLLAY